MSTWEDDRFLNISAYKAVNHCTLYCNLYCQHQDFWTDMEELPETDWILIRRLLLPAAIVVGAAATRMLLLTWLLWRTLATVSNRSNHRNSEPTKTLWRGEWRGCCRVHFSTVEFLLSSDHCPVQRPLWLFHVTLTCRLRKMFPSLFPQ